MEILFQRKEIEQAQHLFEQTVLSTENRQKRTRIGYRRWTPGYPSLLAAQNGTVGILRICSSQKGPRKILERIRSGKAQEPREHHMRDQPASRRNRPSPFRSIRPIQGRALCPTPGKIQLPGRHPQEVHYRKLRRRVDSINGRRSLHVRITGRKAHGSKVSQGSP